MPTPKRKLLVSVVSPVYNNSQHIKSLASEIQNAISGIACEVILVDDGSTDDSWHTIETLAARNDSRFQVKGIKLSRNFGQHIAIYAGLQKARGDYVAVLDADLQDNPVYLPQMLQKALGGADVVHAHRIYHRRTLNRLVAEIVYRILTWASEIKLHAAMGNYKLLSRRALNAALAFKAAQPLFELMVARIGFPVGFVDVERRPRPVNRSAYAFRGSLRFIVNLVASYSSLLFAIMLVVGFFLFIGGCIALPFVAPNGKMASLIFTVLAIQSGLVLLAAGVIGYYIRTVQAAQRNWPIFIVEEEA